MTDWKALCVELKAALQSRNILTHAEMELIARARAYLAQPEPAEPACLGPIPVAERPWEREGFCDAEGRCWFSPWHQQGYAPNWRLIEPYLRHFSDAWCLPAAAIPLPEEHND
jgi:hypothetical protein